MRKMTDEDPQNGPKKSPERLSNLSGEAVTQSVESWKYV